MTAKAFRRIALSLPDTEEGSHMGHTDFRVSGKIFASFPDADEKRGMVKLTPTQQRELLKALPDSCEAAQGAWGRAGCAYIELRGIDAAALRKALLAAWRNTAPKRLLAELGPSDPD